MTHISPSEFEISNRKGQEQLLLQHQKQMEEAHRMGVDVNDTQKQYIKEQEEAFKNAIYPLDTIANHLRDVLENMYDHKMRQVPDQNLDLFGKLAYKNFKRHREGDELMHHLKNNTQTFRDKERDEDIEVAVDGAE